LTFFTTENPASKQNLGLLQSRLNIFLDYLDELGIRRYPILVVAHTSHKERWTVTNERLILRMLDRSANIFSS